MSNPTPAPSPMARFRPPPPEFEVSPRPDPDSWRDAEERGPAWAELLTGRLDERAARINELREYFAGTQPLRFSTEAWIETYGDTFGMASVNFLPRLIYAVIERLSIEGFMTGGDTTTADTQAWDAWVDSGMNLDLPRLLVDTLVTGYGYTLEWPVIPGQMLPSPTAETETSVEDPLHTIVDVDPSNRRRRVAGMKRWLMRDGSWQALVFTPDTWWHLGSSQDIEGAWDIINTGENPIGVVPIVEYTCDPDIYGNGTSELLPVLTLQDSINKLASDEMIVAEHAGYPQRVLLGFEKPEAPETTGDDPPAAPQQPSFQGGPQRWMGFEGEHSKIQTLETADLGVFQKSIEQKVHQMISLVPTPAYYMPSGSQSNVSADFIRASDASTVKRANRHQDNLGHSVAETVRLKFRFKGDQRGNGRTLQPIWGDAEIVTEAARTDSLVKLRGLGFPFRWIAEQLPDMTPQGIDRVLKMIEEESATLGLAQGLTAQGLPPEEPVPSS